MNCLRTIAMIYHVERKEVITLFRYVSGCIIQLGLNCPSKMTCPTGERLSSIPLKAQMNIFPLMSTLRM